jgi:hypothetical protein
MKINFPRSLDPGQMAGFLISRSTWRGIYMPNPNSDESSGPISETPIVGDQGQRDPQWRNWWGMDDLKNSARVNKKLRFGHKCELKGEAAGYGFGVWTTIVGGELWNMLGKLPKSWILPSIWPITTLKFQRKGWLSSKATSRFTILFAPQPPSLSPVGLKTGNRLFCWPVSLREKGVMQEQPSNKTKDEPTKVIEEGNPKACEGKEHDFTRFTLHDHAEVILQDAAKNATEWKLCRSEGLTLPKLLPTLLLTKAGRFSFSFLIIS